MRVLSRRLGKSQPTFLLLLIILVVIAAGVSAEPAGDKTTDAATDAQTTDDRSTTDSTPSVTDTTASTTESTSSTSTSESTTSTTSESSTTSTTMDSTTSTTSDSSTSTSSTTSDSSTTTSSVSTTTTSTSSTSSSTAAAIVTVPPTAGAPYLQTSNTPEGTVFIAVGAILGFIGLAVLAWRGMVAWSVNRSVRRAAMASAKSKHLVRRSQKKRSAAVYSAAPANDVSLNKLGTSHRESYKSSRRVPSNNSGLFYSPTAGGGAAGSHHSLNTAPGNRNSSYLPAGFYAAPGTSTPTRESNSHASMGSPTGYPPGSPSLPPVGTYYDPPHPSRHSYMAASHSSLNLNQAPGGRAPSAYLEDLFENHSSPRNTDSGRR